MSSVGGGLAAVAVVAVAVVVAAVGKAARRYHRGEKIKTCTKFYQVPEVKLKGCIGITRRGKGREVGATVAVKASGAYSL
jgi:hypothetical protein